MSLTTWINRASISIVLLYVTYDAYVAGRTGFALVLAVFLIVGIGVELADSRQKRE